MLHRTGCRARLIVLALMLGCYLAPALGAGAFLFPAPLSTQPGLLSATVTLGQAGATAPIAVAATGHVGPFNAAPSGVAYQPSILVSLSSGASLTYSIEVTGDDVVAPGYNAATGNWSTFTGMGALTASAAGTLGAAVTAVRAHITSYTSGTLTLQFVQVPG